MDVLEEALQASIVRVDLGRPWEGRGKLSQIDGFGLEQGDDDSRQTGDAGTVQREDGLEQVGEFARVNQGVISWRQSLWIGWVDLPQ